MVYESTEENTRSIFLTDQDKCYKVKISDELGDDFHPQIQP